MFCLTQAIQFNDYHFLFFAIVFATPLLSNDSLVSRFQPHSPGTAFRVKSVTRYNPFVSIQSTKSGRYMITDEVGRLKMQNIEDTSRNLKAWFRIEEAGGTDEVDGHPSDGLIQLMIIPFCDHNNNTPKKAFDGVDGAIKMTNNKCIFDRSLTLSFSLWNASVLFCGYMYNMLYYCLSRSR